jgi:hypothetical protein
MQKMMMSGVRMLYGMRSARTNRGERGAEDQQHHVGDVLRGDEPPDELRMLQNGPAMTWVWSITRSPSSAIGMSSVGVTRGIFPMVPSPHTRLSGRKSSWTTPLRPPAM